MTAPAARRPRARRPRARRFAALALFAAAALFATDARAGCEAFPKVPWWGSLTHGTVIRHVRQDLGGDWGAHIGRFSVLHTRLKHARGRNGTVVIKKAGVRLEGQALDAYIENIGRRIDVLLCLAEHASGQGMPLPTTLN